MLEWPFTNAAQDVPGQTQHVYPEPIAASAGDTLTWRRSLQKYPASAGWTLKYSLRGVKGVAFNVESTADGDDHVITITPDQSGNFPAGLYQMAGYAYGPGGERHTVYQGELTISPDLEAADQNTDFRSHARKCLDNIEAVLEGRATNDVLNSTIEGTIIQRIPVRDLLLLRDRYLAEVQSEDRAAKAKNGRATGRNILVRFTTPGL